jgi:hypothetical protein
MSEFLHSSFDGRLTLAREVSNDRGDKIRLEGIDHLLWPIKEESIYSGLVTSRMYTHQMVIVMAVPAIGARQFARMLYFRPSSANVRVSPRIAALAVEYYATNKIKKLFQNAD